MQPIVVVGLIVISAVGVGRLLRKRRPSLPPGPKGWPLIGNLLDMPQEKIWLTFAEWGKKYGDPCSVTVLGQPMVFVNTLSVAKAMLNIKGSIYSDRPVLAMAGELMGYANTMPLMRYGPRFQENRKRFQQLFGTTALAKPFHESEIRTVKTFLRNVTETPEDLLWNIKTHVGTIGLRTMYGYEVTGKDDKFVGLLERGAKHLEVAIAPARYLFDSLPPLRRVPAWAYGPAFNAHAKLLASHLRELVTSTYNFMKVQHDNGLETHSFLSKYPPTSNSFTTGDINEVVWNASGGISGGYSTRIAALHAFFLMITLHPEVQAKAQAEIDAVVGTERLPTFEDRDKLPYVDAVCREVLRFHTVVPTVAHRLIQDDVHDGFFMPEGTLVFPNMWAMLHDPDVYADPDTFNPSRFISSEGHEAESDINEIIYGFGRRSCPGRVPGDESMYIMAAMTLATLNISKAVDANGNVIEPELNPMSGTVSQPTPFQASFKFRSPEAAALVNESQTEF